jgi:release factor glutamine methyltransferase
MNKSCETHRDHPVESVLDTLKSAVERLTCRLLDISDSPRLDAELLVCLCCHLRREALFTHPERPLTPAENTTLNDLLAQRESGVPMAYLSGKREFWSREFHVTPSTLIPRPDTERLIELALERIPANRPCTLLDLGTGSGNIVLTLALERPLLTCIATDRSASALAVARQNATLHAVTRVSWVIADWFSAFHDIRFDVIVSNPPYLDHADSHLPALEHEPHSALVSPQNGLRDLFLLIERAPFFLAQEGELLLEHGNEQGHAVRTHFAKLGYRQIQTHTDLSGQERVTSARCPSD